MGRLEIESSWYQHAHLEVLWVEIDNVIEIMHHHVSWSYVCVKYASVLLL